MNKKLKQIIKEEIAKVMNEIANSEDLKVDNYPIRIVKYTPTSKFQIALSKLQQKTAAVKITNCCITKQHLHTAMKSSGERGAILPDHIPTSEA